MIAFDETLCLPISICIRQRVNISLSKEPHLVNQPQTLFQLHTSGSFCYSGSASLCISLFAFNIIWSAHDSNSFDSCPVFWMASAQTIPFVYAYLVPLFFFTFNRQNKKRRFAFEPIFCFISSHPDDNQSANQTKDFRTGKIEFNVKISTQRCFSKKKKKKDFGRTQKDRIIS